MASVGTRTVIDRLIPVVLGLAACRASSPAPRPVFSPPMSSSSNTPELHPMSSVHAANSAIARAPEAELPIRTTVQEASPGKQLAPAASLPSYFTSTAVSRHEHELARRLVDGVRHAIQAQRWHLEIR